MEESLKETRTKLSELTQQLGLMVGMDNQKQSMDIQKQIPRHEEQLQTEILQIQPVGIDREATKIMELLDMENRGGAARAVIIYGFGVRMDEKNLNTQKLQEQILLEVGGENINLLDYRQGQIKLGVVLSSQPIEYPMETLSHESAKELLRNIVLKSDHVTCVHNELQRIDEIAEACGGVPLLLKVYGEHLWEDGSESSFDEALASLREGEQRGGLVTINEKSDQVIIHDVLRAMGISQAKGTRLRSLEELKATLEEEDKEKLKTIKGIWIDAERLRWWSYEIISDFSIESEMLDLMSNSLRVLALISGIRVDGMCQRKFENLIYLQLGTPFPLSKRFVGFPFKNGLQRFDKLTYLDCTALDEVRILRFNNHIAIKF
eukprot:Gb_37979 [translate_table: standard]